MKVQRVQRVQKVQRVVVAADAADYKKGARLRRRLCRRVEKVQRVAVGTFGAIIYAAYGGPLHHFVDLSPLQAGGTSFNKYSCKVFYKRAPSINERRPTLTSAKRHL